MIEPGAEYKAIASNTLSGRCQVSMAVSAGRFYIRSDTKNVGSRNPDFHSK